MARSLPPPNIGSTILWTSIIACIDDANGSIIDMEKFLLHTKEVALQRKWATAAASDLLNISNARESSPPPSPDRLHEKKMLTKESMGT